MHTIPLGSGRDVQVLVVYHPRSPAATRLRTAAPGFEVTMRVAHTSSSLMVLVVVLCTLVVAPLLPCLVGARSWRSWTTTQSIGSKKMWQLMARTGARPRFTHTWIQVMLVSGVYLALVGGAWVLAFGLMRHAAPVSAAEWAGVGVACAGLLLLGGVGLRALRDDVRQVCPVCHKPTSRWRFVGTYFPQLLKDAPPAKGHTSCLRCVLCRKPVVTDLWAGAPAHRRLHASCWDLHCGRVCAQPDFGPAWGSAPEVTEEEVAALVVATIRHPSLESTRALLDRFPDLRARYGPVWGDYPSALHCAARAGNVPALRLLLEGRAGPPDVPVCADDPAACSFGFTSLLPEQNDVYVFQPPATYNARPVYVGHRTGQYLYYYEPDEGAPGRAGWCIHENLGSSAPEFRVCLNLPTGSDDFWDDSDEEAKGRIHSALKYVKRTSRKGTQFLRRGSSLRSPRRGRSRSWSLNPFDRAANPLTKDSLRDLVPDEGERSPRRPSRLDSEQSPEVLCLPRQSPGLSFESEMSPRPPFSLRTAWGHRWQDAVNRRQLAVDCQPTTVGRWIASARRLALCGGPRVPEVGTFFFLEGA